MYMLEAGVLSAQKLHLRFLNDTTCKSFVNVALTRSTLGISRDVSSREGRRVPSQVIFIFEMQHMYSLVTGTSF